MVPRHQGTPVSMDEAGLPDDVASALRRLAAAAAHRQE
jgi:hypothetical protein